MAGKKIGIVIACDGEQKFKQDMQNARKESSMLNAELKKLSVEFDGNANSMDFLRQKQEILTKQQEAYQKKVNAAQEGLNKANSNLNKQSKRLVELQDELTKAQKKLQEMRSSEEENTEACQKQEKEVVKLAEAVTRQTLARQKEVGVISDWNKKIYDSEAELKKANKAIENNAKYLTEAKKSTDKTAKSIDGYGDEVQKATEWTQTWKEALKDGFAEDIVSRGMDAATEVMGAIKDTMYDISGASAKLQASTGATTAAMNKYNAVMKAVKGNFGESYSDVAEAMEVVIQTMGELDSVELQNVTENAMTLLDTFGYDYQEQLRAVNMLMQQFGITSTEAYNLIVQGTQQGLNKNGDLLDTINEYSVHYAQMGVSAEGFFNSLANGTEAGTFSVDKLGDAYKEFGIRVKDTATTTDEAYELLGLNADKMRKMFTAGGDSAEQAADIVLDALMSMDDKVKQNQAGVDLFGTMWEDLGITGVQALTNLEGEISSTKSAMESLKDVRYSDLESAVSGLGAAIEENITTPIAESALPAVTGLFEKATEIVSGIGEAIAPQKTELQTFVDEIAASNDQVNTLLDNAKKSMSGADTETRNLEAYKAVLLELNDAEGKTEYQKFQVKTAVDALAESIPELAAAFDEEAGKINLTSTEIAGLIENQEELIKQQAYAKASQEAYEALATAQLNQAKAQSALEQAEKARADYLAEDAQRASNIANGVAALKVTEEINKLNIAVDTAQKELDEANSSVKDAEGIIKDTEDAIQDLTSAEEQNSSATDVNTQRQEQLAARRQEAAEAAEANAAATENEATATDKAAEAAKAGAEAQKEAAKSISDTYHGYVDEIKADLQDKISLFDKFETSDGGENMSVEKMTANLDSQIEAYQEYAENLAAVKEHVGKEIAPEFMQYLESMGMEGSNTLKHIVATFEDSEPEKVKEMSDKWVEAMDMTEGIAEVNAANKLAYEMSIKEFGSSEADFSALSESVNAAVSSAAEGWQNLPAETKAALDEVIKTAQDCGVQIPEGLQEGIENGDVTPESAIEQLNGAIQGSFDGLKEVANELGLSIPESLQEGIDAGGQDAADAFNKLVDTISAQSNTSAMQQKGRETGEEYADGIESTTGEAETAADAVSQAAVDAVSEKTGAFQTAGNSAAQAYYQALEEQKGQAAQAGGALGSAAYNAAAAWKNAFYNTGYNLSAGMAQGMIQGSPVVEAAARKVVSNAKTAAQQEADEHSPSVVWRKEIGLNLSKGAALGILDGQKDVMAAARDMARSALTSAQEELDIHSPSKKFRNKVGQNISESTAFGIKDKASLAGKEAAKMSEQVYKKASAWLTNYKKSHKVSTEDEKYYWQQVLEHTKKGTTAYEKVLSKISGVSLYTKKNGEKVKKDAETFYSEVYQAAQEYYEKITVNDEMSLKQQRTYWENVQKTLKKGTQAWRDAQAQINSIQAKIGTVSNAAAVLSAYQTYYEMSEQAVVDYWDTVRKEYEAGTDERLEADQKYFDAKEKLNDKLIELEEDYYDAVQEIDEKIEDEIKSLTEDYESQLKSRTDAIKNAFSLFDEFESESADGKTLLFNIKAQAAGYEDWMGQLDELESKGILNDDLMDELKEQGPEISAAIHALNSLTSEELSEYNTAYLKKMELSRKQAEEDTEDLKKSVEEQTKALNAQKEAEKAEMLKSYEQNVSKVTTGMSTSLQTLAENVRSIAEDQTTALVAAIRDTEGLKEAAVSSSSAGTASASGSTSGSTASSASSSNSSTSSSGMSMVKTEETASALLSDTAQKLLQAAQAAAQQTTAAQTAAATNQTAAAAPTQTAAVTATAQTATATQATDKILEIINSYPKRVTLSDNELKTHSDLFKYIYKNYKRKPGHAMYKELADALGVKADSQPTAKQRDNILKKLKEKGYRSGARNLLEELIWMDEDLDTVGPELLVRKADNAILTRIKPGDDVVNAETASNMAKWAQYKPESAQEALLKMQEQIVKQQATLKSYAETLNLSGIAKLNELLEHDTSSSTTSVSGDISRLENLVSSVIDIMSEFLPNLSYLKERQQIVLDSGAVVGGTVSKMSNELAMRSRRRR